MTDPLRYLFLRNDDVYALDRRFIKLFGFCITNKVPINYGVIPGLLDKNTAEYLLEHKKKYPQLLDIAQHGWSHANHGSKKNRYEFGKGRSYTQQKKDISSGSKKMSALFGDRFAPVFIPPFHLFDHNTLRVIKELGFLIFSAGREKMATTTNAYLSVPAQVRINRYSPSFKRLPLSLPDVIKATAYQLKQSKIVGAYVHHSSMDIHNFEQFIKYLSVLKQLERKNLIRMVLFSDILNIANHSGRP